MPSTPRSRDPEDTNHEQVIRIAKASRIPWRGAVSGDAVLRELCGKPGGLFAFRMLRALELWCVHSRETGELFSRPGMESLVHAIAGAREMSDELRKALVAIACELASDVPNVSQMELGCVFVSNWAVEAGARNTALAFADAAAVLALNPRYVFFAGKLHRTLGEPRDAEMWLQRASAFASRALDWETKVRSVGALGVFYFKAGMIERARRTLQAALACARRRRLKEFVGEIWHHLFIVAADSNAWKEADLAAREAVLAYGRDDERLPCFAHDLAVYSILRGHYRSALDVLLVLVTRHWRDEPANLLLAQANTARAAAGCRSVAEYKEATAAFTRLADRLAEVNTRATALLSAAYGAFYLERWADAATWVHESVRVARAKGETAILAEALSLSEQIQNRRASTSVQSRWE